MLMVRTRYRVFSVCLMHLRDGSCVSFDRTNVPDYCYVCAYKCVQVRAFTRPLCNVRYKGLLFTARFIFHRNIMENGLNVMRNV